MIDASSDAPLQSPFVRTARILAIAASVAMLLLCLWLFGIAADHPWRDAMITLVTLYSATILAFLGGVRWAMAFADPRSADRRDIIVGILPALVAPAILFISMPAVFGLLAAAFAAMGAWDSLSSYAGTVPEWYGRLRTQSTAVLVVALIIAFVATS